MEFRHLGTTSLETHCMLQVGGRQVQQRHDELLRMAERTGLRERLVFAEPIVTWPSGGEQGHVAWYADVRGSAPAMASLTGRDYDRAAALLREALTKFLAASFQPDEVALLRAACVLAAMEGVLVDGERLVLLGWGLVPGRSGRLLPEVPQLEATPLARFRPSAPDVPDIALPGSKGASPQPRPALTPEPASVNSAAFETSGDPSPSGAAGKSLYVWHATTAAVFALLGFLAGMRMVAPGRLADWLDLGGL